MKSGWSGGQYSVYRALLAVQVAVVIVDRFREMAPPGPISATLGLAALACGPLAVGWRDRGSALLLLLVLAGPVAFLDGAPLVLPRADNLLTLLLLALHSAVPSRPYGAWDARGRNDPAGDWRMPGWIPSLAWGLLALIHLGADLERVGAARPGVALELPVPLAAVGLVFDVLFAAALFRRGWRPAAWIALSLWKLACLAAYGPTLVEANLWLLHVLCFDPAWIPGRSRFAARATPGSEGARLFYDGDCGLCHRSVRFVLAEDGGSPEPLRLRFAPLGGERFRAFLEEHPELHADELPDSILLELEDGSVRSRSAAAIEIAERLGGLWRALARCAELAPTRLLDAAYDGLARRRKRLFASPEAACPLLTPELRARFDL